MNNKEAIKNIKEHCYFANLIPQAKEALDMAIQALEQESKTGYWIKYGIPRCEEQHYKCTSCEYYINFGRWGEFYAREFKYCPHCGAEMEGEQDEV